MNKSELIFILNELLTPENLILARNRCVEELQTSNPLRLDDGGYKFPTEHFYKIYWGRSQNRNLDLSHFIGFLESVENLKTDHGILRAISGDTERDWFLVLISEASDLVGCIVKDKSLG